MTGPQWTGHPETVPRTGRLAEALHLRPIYDVDFTRLDHSRSFGLPKHRK